MLDELAYAGAMFSFSRNCFLTACPLCHTACERVGLCAACANDLPAIRHGCAVCRKPLTQDKIAICGACVSKPPPYDCARIPFAYIPPVSWFVSQLKYHQQLALSRVLAELFATHITEQQYLLPQCILPVPLYRSRLQQRGFNQSFEIAKIVAQRLGIACSHQYLAKVRATPAQTALTSRARERNLRRAFALKKPIPFSHVAIMDDVVTTGTTVRELAKLLKEEGVETVEVWALARTL